MTGSPIRPMTTLLAAALISHAALAAAPATRASDPWAKVPAWPTACYASQDRFSDSVASARQAIEAERSRQDEINRRITSQAGSEAAKDPMAQAQRMQQYLMKDPQHAMAQIQAMGAANPAATMQQTTQANARYEQAKAGDKTFMAQYQAARKAMLGPARTRMQALGKRAAKSLVHTEAGDFWPEWAFKEAAPIMQEANNAYVPFCAQWFGAGGKVPAYLQQRKTFLVTDRIPALQHAIDEPAVTGQQMLGHSTDGYRSIAPHDAVHDYLGLASELFGMRASNSASCSTYTNCSDEFGLLAE